MNSRLYIDDLIHSLEKTDLAYTTHEQIKLIFGETSFNVRKWRTNVHSSQDLFNEKGNNESTSCKVLDYSWNSADNVLNVDSHKEYTKNIRNN